MYPTLFSIGPLTIYSFGVFAALGFLFSMIILNKLAKKHGLKIAFILDHLIPIILVSLLSARFAHVLLKWELYSNRFTEILFFWQGGLNLWGAIIGAGFYFWYLCYRNSQDVLVWLDQIAFSIQSIFILGYIGYMLSPAGLSGNAFGKPTELPWGISLPQLDSPYAGLAVHPVIIYLILGHILILLVLLKMKKLRKLAGLSLFTFSSLLGIITIITEPLKYNPNYLIGKYSFASYMASLMLLTSIAGFIYVFRMDKKYRSYNKSALRR